MENVIIDDQPKMVTKTKTTHVVRDGVSVNEFQTGKTIIRLNQILWYILGIIEVLIAFRIILKLLAANPNSGFVNFIYSLSEPFIYPFRGIFTVIVTQRSVMEWSSLFAMIVYAILVYGIMKLIQMAKPVTPQEIDRNLNT